ncbi:Alpha/Beta hydrolase protein [Plectosphaerella plurivora]|uniref:carboxypeptidase C n=1 Tax=Plectosphaerella plurivora TaxID=936078 RepID=A0A9P8VFB2_9PEZI|nr:Alpha/Beta hydrolase protein [Plectosphaerella plurivora]
MARPSSLPILTTCAVALLLTASTVLASGAFRTRPAPESLCPGAGEGMVGYYDFGDEKDSTKHLFFWFAESRNDPDQDPLILWMSGGPGASSVGFGLFQELGPCQMTGPGTAEANKYAWNNNANVIFVDQPVRVGYSYSDNPATSLEETTEDMYQFIAAFVRRYPRFATQDFYIIGESAGGSYVPALAKAIDHRQSPDEGLGHINLRGIGLGNAQLSESLQWPGFFATGCVSDAPLFNASTCAALDASIPECVRMLEICAGETTVCDAVLAHCRQQSVNLIVEAGLNPYDFRMECQDMGECYPQQAWTRDHLDSAVARSALGVAADQPLSMISMEVNADLMKSGFSAMYSVTWVEELLEKDYRVLVYVGNKDWFCNVEGERQMVNGMQWSHQAGFRAMEERPWTVGAQESGTFKQLGNLAFAEIFDSGHMAPADKRAETLFLMNSWLNGTMQADR